MKQQLSLDGLATVALCLAQAGAAQLTALPSLRPSLVPSLNPSLRVSRSLAPVDPAVFGSGNADCAAVGTAEIPGCAQECFLEGAAALGCWATDLSCQCQQQARMMAAAESCVAEFCPSIAYQSVIDGVMAMCGCAVGVATAQLTQTMGASSATATVASGMTVVSGMGSSAQSLRPAPTEFPGLQGTQAQNENQNQHPLVAGPVTPPATPALGSAATIPARASGAAPRRHSWQAALAACVVTAAAGAAALL